MTRKTNRIRVQNPSTPEMKNERDQTHLFDETQNEISQINHNPGQQLYCNRYTSCWLLIVCVFFSRVAHMNLFLCMFAVVEPFGLMDFLYEPVCRPTHLTITHA